MTTQSLTAETFEQTVLDNDIVLVDFWASWCGPCRTFAPIFDKASTTHPDIIFGKVDTEQEQSLSAAARITSIPTLMAFREGILVFSQPGALPAASLEQVIAGVRGLDMEDLRAQTAESQPAESPPSNSQPAEPEPAKPQATEPRSSEPQATRATS